MATLNFHPGETIALNFVLPFSIYDVQAVAISFRNENRVAFETVTTGVAVENENSTRVGYILSQEESLQFDENSHYKMQLNVFGPNGSRTTSREIDVFTGPQHITTPGFTEVNTFNYNGTVVGMNGDIVSYNDLVDKPQINSQVLIGNRILPEFRITNAQINELINE